MQGEQTFTVGGKEITLTRNAVEQAVRNIKPGPIKKYSVLIRGVRYPIKQAISVASGQPSAVFIATDAYRILKRLGFQIDGEILPQVRRKLALHPIGWVREGPMFGTGPAFQYRVAQMPPGYQALISNFGAPQRSDWKIMRIEDDTQEEWSGTYASAEEALSVLQQEFDLPIGEDVVVQVEGGGSFPARIELRLDSLDPSNMPREMTGTFTRLPTDLSGGSVNADFLIHSDRANGGSSHTIWLHGNRTGYRFKMTSERDFLAEKV